MSKPLVVIMNHENWKNLLKEYANRIHTNAEIRLTAVEKSLEANKIIVRKMDFHTPEEIIFR